MSHVDSGLTHKQVMLTEGPLTGQRVIVLDPVKVTPFRFLDLPPELRQRVYDLLLIEEKPIKVGLQKVPGGTKVMRHSLRWAQNRRGLLYNDVDALLRLDKETHHETATTFYGRNSFMFNGTGIMDRFINGIGDQKHFVREVRLGPGNYGIGKAKWAFAKLHDAKDLHSVVIDHATVCPDAGHHGCVPFTQIAQHCTAMMRGLCQSKGAETALRIVKFVHAGSEMCSKCKDGKKSPCRRAADGCKTVCEDLVKHCAKLEDEFRAQMKKALKMD